MDKEYLNLGYLDKEVKQPAYDDQNPESLNQCFMDNLELLLNNAELIITTKEYSNITVPFLRCGIMYSNRHRPLTLGEILSYYKKGIYVSKKRKKACCDTLYSYSIGASPLSGTTWQIAFCPKCKKTFRFTSDNARPLLAYLKNAPFEYEPSPLTIFQLVEKLKAK